MGSYNFKSERFSFFKDIKFELVKNSIDLVAGDMLNSDT